MTDVVSVDPRTGAAVETVARETTAAGTAALCATAAEAAPGLEALGRSGRADLLDTLADALQAHRDEVVAVADRETALGPARLNGELTRTCYQLRLFGEVLREGSYLEATIDHAADTPMGPRPDLRRMLVPIGPVAVFGASNFPLAFSVPGGDTVSALAAGSPVVVKAHESHPATSALCALILAGAATKAGAPEGTVGIVYGRAAGVALVTDSAIRAVGFTGSLGGGQALMDAIASRPDPIPFFGELAGLNPVVVTPAAAAERGAAIGAELAGSFTLGGGQFCTKPGVTLVPTGPDGDALVAAAADAVRGSAAPVLLNGGIAASYAEIAARLSALPSVGVVASGAEPGGDGFGGAPLLLTAPAGAVPDGLDQECFGPLGVILRYDDRTDLLAALAGLPSSLTATVQRGTGETELPAAVVRALRDRAGRILFDAYPTGVAVSWAQHHGGPWPSTNTQHTSVGASAIRRFLRPVTWQNAPAELLPAELTDDRAAIPRRVDGVLVTGA
ncbi:aldehyde dehydrogenase (NADP(+)) [Pseudonocardia nantongensis]|uniref:aldehyde dehydrogenase (NADP(+)) n=1 Tax=Pseudonocardia nantongensis TaxID=1181885 RepID=UPI003977E914